MPESIDVDLTFIKQLGVGGFAEVYLYRNQIKQVAVKIQKKEMPGAKKQPSFSGFSSEAYTFRQLQKQILAQKLIKRIPDFYGDTYIDNRQCLKIQSIEYSVEEYIQLKSDQQDPEKRLDIIKDMSLQMLECIKQIHSLKYVH